MVPVHDLVREHAARKPYAIAVSWDGGTVGYGELLARAGTVTAALRRSGPVQGRSVAVRMPQGPDRIAALLAVLGAGAHLAWLGTGDTGDRGRSVICDLRPVCMLVQGDPADDDLAIWYRDEQDGSVIDAGAIGEDGGKVAFHTAEPEDWAYVAHTSGSTGRPKGIPQTHGAFAQFVAWFAEEFGIGDGTRVAQWVAPEHDPAISELFATLVGGGTVYPVPERIRAHPVKFARWLAENRIALVQTIPSFAREVLRAVNGHGLAGELAALHHILLMGEAVPPELVYGLRETLPGARLINLYGPTETIAATWHPITGELTSDSVPIGRAIPGRQVLVVDNQDRPCPDGEIGEIVVHSPYVTPGYIGSAAGRESPFRPLRGEAPGPRTYRTGDLARRLPDGALEFRGRKDLQVKVAGQRIELADVEMTLEAHGSVTECAVVALHDQNGLASRLVAYIVPAGAAAVPDLRARLRRRFGREMPPVTFEIMDRPLPRNVAGKVDRRKLPISERQ